MIIKTSEENEIKKIFKKLNLPKADSHKGENGKVLIIGGSSLFHSASLWAAEVASYFVDIVHYSSTEENMKIFINLKSKFRNGIIIPRKNLVDYVKEDDSILIGPGMLRNLKIKEKKQILKNLKKILLLKNEAAFTYHLTGYLMDNFSQKRFVFDAGSLQMMDKGWLRKLKTKPILTPHQKEFSELFGIEISNFSFEKKIRIVEDIANDYHAVILLKAIKDIVSDGKNTVIIEGGNQGLTKGGTGDLLSGLCLSLYAKNEAFLSAVCASIILKKTSEHLYGAYGYWYNINNLLSTIPKIFNQLVLK